MTNSVCRGGPSRRSTCVCRGARARPSTAVQRSVRACCSSSRVGRATGASCLVLALVTLVTNARAADDLPPEVGYNYGEIENPRTLALGGAQRALSYSLGGLFINPANMASTAVYHLGGLAEIWPEANRVSYGGGAVDSIVNSKGLAGGIGGSVSRQDRDGIDREYNDLRFALALPFQDKFFVGLGGRFLWLSQDGPGPLGRSLASSGLNKERIVTGFTFDGGVTIKPAEGFSLAVVGNNLSDPGTGFQPLSAGGGLGYSVTEFGVEGDVVFDFTTWQRTTVRAMGGAEVLVAESVPVRVGYRYDQGAESHAVSGGIGYVDRSFAADVALRRVVSGDKATAIVLGFTVHLEATGLTPAPANAF